MNQDIFLFSSSLVFNQDSPSSKLYSELVQCNIPTFQTKKKTMNFIFPKIGANKNFNKLSLVHSDHAYMCTFAMNVCLNYLKWFPSHNHAFWNQMETNQK
jgi:hypothetical protein